jgi:hypothetical protein
MALMGIGVFFYSIVQLTNAVMQAHGHASIPVVNMLLAGVMRLIVVYLLTGNGSVQLLGAPIGAALCYLAIGVMNLIAMGKAVPQKPPPQQSVKEEALAAPPYAGYDLHIPVTHQPDKPINRFVSVDNHLRLQFFSGYPPNFCSCGHCTMFLTTTQPAISFG